jgi:uncharacterized protein YdhG (YjbR/CyaY superfamily)
MRTMVRTIDDYLAALPAEARDALEILRNQIKAIVPEAEECISYSMPAFRLDGHVVAGFKATRKGCSYYPFSGRTLATLAADLAGYDQTKSALHFDPGRPLPKGLVRRLIKTRIAETTLPRDALLPRAPTRTARPRRGSKLSSS